MLEKITIFFHNDFIFTLLQVRENWMIKTLF